MVDLADPAWDPAELVERQAIERAQLVRRHNIRHRDAHATPRSGGTQFDAWRRGRFAVHPRPYSAFSHGPDHSERR
jgi:hypothetical protein